MKRYLLILLCTFSCYIGTYACGGLTQQCQSGGIRYSFDEADPMVVTITATMYFDVFEGLANDSIFISWGDNTFNSVFATAIAPDTSVPPGIAIQAVYEHVYIGKHRYDSIPSSGFYNATVLLQFRPNSITNIGNGQTGNPSFYIEALITPGIGGEVGNHAPVISTPKIIFGNLNDTLHIIPSFTEPDGDSIVFDVISPLQDHNSPIPMYVFPDSFCNYHVANSSSFSINHHTGEITWTSPCFQGIYTVTTLVSKYRNNKLMGTIIRDQNIYITDGLSSGINPLDLTKTGIQIFPNPAQSILNGTFTNLSSDVAFAKIFSVDGSLVMDNISLKKGDFMINISTLSPGIYLLQTSVNGQGFTSKFVKIPD